MNLTPSYSRGAERGAVLLISLIILAVLLAAGAALVRSFDTSLFQAGNLAFKRDLANQADRVMPIVIGRFQGTGSLSVRAKRGTSSKEHNYSATTLATNAQGIPDALLLDATGFQALPFATTGNDLTSSNTNGVGEGITIRYVVDRLCAATGDEQLLAETQCSAIPLLSAAGTPPPVLLQQIIYRVSIRVDGPRNTQAFFQSTLSL